MADEAVAVTTVVPAVPKRSILRRLGSQTAAWMIAVDALDRKHWAGSEEGLACVPVP